MQMKKPKKQNNIHTKTHKKTQKNTQTETKNTHSITKIHKIKKHKYKT